MREGTLAHQLFPNIPNRHKAYAEGITVYYKGELVIGLGSHPRWSYKMSL